MAKGQPAVADVPDEIFEAVRARCLALPETTLRSDRWAHAFEIRRRIFAWLFAAADTAGRHHPMLVVEADPDERRALLAIGTPYFPAGGNQRRVGVLLTDETDWVEIAELITESYRILAPKKLSALLDC